VIERVAFGELPRKHHIALHGADGALRFEECITQDGFEGPYTIAYHVHRPHEQRSLPCEHGFPQPVAAPEASLRKRHYRTPQLHATGKSGAYLDSRIPLLFSTDLTIGIAKPRSADPVYFADGDADTLLFIHEGGGVVRTMLGDVRFERHDYVYVPRALLHRIVPTEAPQHWLVMEFKGGLHLPRQWRNEVGQLRMDAPYCHRDFRLPTFEGPRDEGIRAQVVRRHGRFFGFEQPHSPLDVVGWDGAVYPWAFPITNFQARAGLVHLPPTWHGTFAAKSALVCSFVPRVVDWHPDAIPCPYPHSSVDVDEFLFYVEGNFTSRRGVDAGSVSFHPSGVPHGPHPGAYEASRGTHRTSELAVMIDSLLPLTPTTYSVDVEDPHYENSFVEG
jgi:homogentisate 1,2-dioxygenase